MDTLAWFPNPATARLFILVFGAWAVSEVVNRVVSYRSAARTRRRDRGSYWVVYLAVWGSLALAFGARALHWGTFQNALQAVGLGLAAFGIAFREWAVLALGRFFTVSVTVAPDHALVQRGPYRWLRHPAYTGSILTLVGLPLALGTWVGAAAALALSVAGFLYRARIEEQALLDALGDEYRQYMRHTGRFFPGL